MDIKKLFRKIVLGAAKSSLDVAGAAVLPGVWPYVKGALSPVLKAIDDQLDGGKATDSLTNAQLAAQMFEQDTRLQEMFKSAVLPAIAELAKGQDAIASDVQMMMAMLSDDQAALAAMGAQLDDLQSGVTLDEATMDRLADKIARRAETSDTARKLALRETGAAAEMAMRQVWRLQVRSVELINDGQFDRAMDELNEGAVLVSTLLRETPTDVMLILNLGMIYKTRAQVFQAVGDKDRFADQLTHAEWAFKVVEEDIPGDQKTVLDLSNALHGLGNLKQAAGDVAGAATDYRRALALNHTHPYAWHDLFLCLHAQAEAGEDTRRDMRHALDKVIETGAGQPGLGQQHLDRLEAVYAVHAARFASA